MIREDPANPVPDVQAQVLSPYINKHKGKRNSMQNKVIVFDVDGTLFDTKAGITSTINDVLSRYNMDPIDTEADKYIGPPIKQSLIKYKGFMEKDAEEATLMYRSIYINQYISMSKLYDGMEETLQTLISKGYKLCIATMKTKSQIDKLLDISGCEKYFDLVYAAREDGSLSKGQMLNSIKQETNHNATYYMVGDTMGDYNAAKEAGYKFIAADYGYGKIEAVDCTHVKSAEEILQIMIHQD